ncbi:MAG TPA: hypothetical protein VFC44_10795 [Candidatus Saccharimonadales bacterium]|nr:hypothetical protein [Candidatus Saccharimonadales bacterium]
MRRAAILFLLTAHVLGATPSLNEAINSKEDLWGDAAMRQPDGPSLEFFRSLLPPLHYVNADFRHYPIILSGPRALHKSRFASNGSGINMRANTSAWNEIGTPILFRVGNDEQAYGEFLDHLEGPKWEEGFLPIVQLTYQHADGVYAQETFASVNPIYASNAISLTRFHYSGSQAGRMAVLIETSEPLQAESHRILNQRGEVLLWFEGPWKWHPARRVLVAAMTNGAELGVAVATPPAQADTPSPLASNGFARERKNCIDTWQSLLRGGMSVEVPEPEVNNAWRALIIANFSLIHGDRIFYSAGNAYERLYEQEGSAAALALLAYGFEDVTRRLLLSLLDFTRKGLEYHQAGHKLDDVCRFYWQTRDAGFVRSIRPQWEQEVKRLAGHRSPTNGLYPREQYCGDIPTPVFSLNSNAKGWRALRDTAALLEEIGDQREADRLQTIAVDFRKNIMRAITNSIDTKLDPPFVPNALLHEEQPYDVITKTRMGSYWNLMANNILGTEIFGSGSELEGGMLRYFQEHGGLCMGLVRARAWPAFWVGVANLNPLYGWYYVRTLLRRDEPDRALVSFYGMLAAGLTPDTFTCGEACALEPVDRWGRQYYLPPNSAGNAFWLEMFRNLLVQDWDLNDDGRPDTLRLLFATPKRWLADGQTITVERAPTAFGPVSMRVQSKLRQGAVIAEVDLPQRNPPRQTQLRARLPDGWRVTSASVAGHAVPVDEHGTADLSSLTGKVILEFKVKGP